MPATPPPAQTAGVRAFAEFYLDHYLPKRMGPDEHSVTIGFTGVECLLESYAEGCTGAQVLDEVARELERRGFTNISVEFRTQLGTPVLGAIATPPPEMARALKAKDVMEKCELQRAAQDLARAFVEYKLNAKVPIGPGVHRIGYTGIESFVAESFDGAPSRDIKEIHEAIERSVAAELRTRGFEPIEVVSALEQGTPTLGAKFRRRPSSSQLLGRSTGRHVQERAAPSEGQVRGGPLSKMLLRWGRG